jgi:hypothetical protein
MDIEDVYMTLFTFTGARILLKIYIPDKNKSASIDFNTGISPLQAESNLRNYVDKIIRHNSPSIMAKINI